VGRMVCMDVYWFLFNPPVRDLLNLGFGILLVVGGGHAHPQPGDAGLILPPHRPHPWNHRQPAYHRDLRQVGLVRACNLGSHGRSRTVPRILPPHTHLPVASTAHTNYNYSFSIINQVTTPKIWKTVHFLI